MKRFMAGADDMSTTLGVMILAGLLAAGLFTASQWRRYRIRHTGALVTAHVTQVQSWRDGVRADISLQSKMLPFLGGQWWYEIRAEWTDPQTGNTYVFTSGIQKGLSGYQRGDSIAAYVSPYGTYLKLS